MLKYLSLGLKISDRLFNAILIRLKKSLKLSTKPLFINFLLTYQCNSRCIMCNIWQKYQKNPKLLKKELLAKDIKKFLIKNKDYLSQVKNVGITGGEPLIKDDLVEIIKLFHKYLPQARLGIQTNGLLPKLLKEKLSEILKFCPDFGVSISLDGRRDVHDKVRGTKGAFDKYLASVKVLKDFKIKDITSGLTISDLNYKHILGTAKLVEKHGIEFSCFLPDVSDYYFDNKDQKPILSKKAIISVKKTLKNFRYHYFMDNLRLQLEKKSKRTLPCYSGYTSITIDPFGEVRACILRSESFGNIKSSLLKDILFNKHGWQIRDKLRGCSCWCQCEISTSALTDTFDVLRWFLTKADKKEFIKKLENKLHRL